MDFIIVFCIVFAFVVWYRRPRGAPPGPRGVPLLGTIPFLTMRPDKKFQEWSKTYGNVMSVRMARNDWVVLSGLETITEALVRKGKVFSGRPIHFGASPLSGYGHGLLFANGRLWETQRRFGLATFREMGVGKRSFENRVIEETHYLVEALQRNTDLACDFSKDITNAIANVICNVIFGRRFEYELQRFKDLSKYDVISNPRKALILNASFMMSFLQGLPPFKGVLKEAVTNLHEVFDLYREEFREHESDLDSRDCRDFIDAFLTQKKRDEGERSNFTEKQLLFYIRDLFGAATETTANSLLWCFLGLLHYQNHQKNIFSEICDVIGDDADPTMAHREHMPFTMAYLEEIMRYCSVAQLSVPRRTTADVEIGGYLIRKDTQIMASIWSVHNDPSVFKNPSEFRPGRFLDSEGRFLRSRHVIPFSIGSRNCLGEQLARMELFLFFVSVLRRCKIEPDPNSQLPGLEDGKLGITYAPKKYKAIFSPR